MICVFFLTTQTYVLLLPKADKIYHVGQLIVVASLLSSATDFKPPERVRASKCNISRNNAIIEVAGFVLNSSYRSGLSLLLKSPLHFLCEGSTLLPVKVEALVTIIGLCPET
jgi:hypothetical protein